MEKKTLREFIRYCLIGGCTTAINYFIYIGVLFFFQKKYLFANTIAWGFAVLFAFYANKHFVFQETRKGGKSDKEALSFFTMRLITLLIENVLLYVCIQQLQLHSLVSKLIVSVITILANYILCKYAIFTEEKGGMIYEEN
ncbi:GtrA family protein [Faecalimonas sp.]